MSTTKEQAAARVPRVNGLQVPTPKTAAEVPGPASGNTKMFDLAVAVRLRYENRPEETKYIYTDNDSQGRPLNGQNSYAITFPKGQTPPSKGSGR